MKNHTKINLSIDDLILDPNNPRFSKNEQDIIQDEDRYADEEVQQETLRKMTSDNEFDISSLEKSIKKNGFLTGNMTYCLSSIFIVYLLYLVNCISSFGTTKKCFMIS